MISKPKLAYYRTYQKAFMLAECLFDWSEPYLLKGAGAIKELPALVKSKGINNVLIVTDKGLMGLHLLDSLFEALDALKELRLDLRRGRDILESPGDERELQRGGYGHVLLDEKVSIHECRSRIRYLVPDDAV